MCLLCDRYEAEIRTLRLELESRGIHIPQPHVGGPPTHAGPSQAPPPALGHGPANLFGGIMTNPGGGAPALAPPPPPQDQQQPPQHALQQPGSGAQGPPQPQQGAFGGYQPASAVNGMLQAKSPPLGRRRKKITEEESISNDPYTGYGPPPPPPTSSPGPGKGRANRAPPGPATPQQNHQVAYPDPRASPQIPRPTPPGQQLSYRVGNTLADLDPDKLPPSQKREGSDWYAVFNPEVPRVLDVDLVHHLVHDSVVCCVRFSNDGKYVATGCNRSAQIFDVATGQLVTALQDDSVLDKEGDLYIRSVCFSPDGRYLATGAEDKQIRVRTSPFLSFQ